MKKWIVCLALVAVMSFGSRAYAYYEGYIAWDENLVASTNWANTSCVLSWIVSFDSATNYWTYQYTFTTDGKPGISHVITEVSETFDEENVEAGTTASYELGTYLPANPSNPGIPGSLYGMKFNVPAESDGTLYVWTIVTDRAPIWGDFYAKGGSDTYAYNTQFGVANDSPVEDNPNLIGWAVVPDTVTTIPEPSTLIFLGLGILFIALMLKRNMKSMKIIISKGHKE